MILGNIFYPRKSFLEPDEKDVLISVQDDIQVGVRLFLVDKEWPTILYFHGNAELAQEYDSIASMYNNFQLNIIVADYRGYGLSGGTPNKNNLHEDAIKIFDYLSDYLKHEKYHLPLVVMGRSLGSASVSEIISKREESIGKCIIESGFATEYPLLRLMNINPKEINYSLEDGFGNLSKLKKFKKPLYIIHADMDDIIPFSEAELIIKESESNQKDLLRVSGANHNNIIATINKLYFQKIKDFIYSK